MHSKSTIFNGTICHCCENNGQYLKNCIAQFPYIPTPIFILFIAFIFIFQSIKFRKKIPVQKYRLGCKNNQKFPFFIAYEEMKKFNFLFSK